MTEIPNETNPAVKDDPSMPDDVRRDLAIYQMLLVNWGAENPIKTNKLQVLLAANAILVSGAGISGDLTADKWYLYLAGALFSLIWTFSIGRTALFQSIWKIKMDAIRARHRDNPYFSILDTDDEEKKAPALLRALGLIPSKYYLVLSPLFIAIAWIAILLFSLFRA